MSDRGGERVRGRRLPWSTVTSRERPMTSIDENRDPYIENRSRTRGADTSRWATRSPRASGIPSRSPRAAIEAGPTGSRRSSRSRSTTSRTRTSRCEESSSDRSSETQVEPAIALKPDLVTFSAGGNDVLRPGSDPDVSPSSSRTPWCASRRTAPTSWSSPGIDVNFNAVFRSLRGKIAIYNENIRTIASDTTASSPICGLSRRSRTPASSTTTGCT